MNSPPPLRGNTHGARLLAAANEYAGRVLAAWGGSFLTKTGRLETDDQAYRSVLKQIPLYARAAESNLPFPKTRRIVFLENQPAALPGWARLEIA